MVEIPRQAGKLGNLYSGESFICVLIGGCWCGEAGGRLSRSETSNLIGLEAYLTFSGWSSVESQGKRKKKKWKAGSPSFDCPGVIAVEFVGPSCIVVRDSDIIC